MKRSIWLTALALSLSVGYLSARADIQIDDSHTPGTPISGAACTGTANCVGTGLDFQNRNCNIQGGVPYNICNVGFFWETCTPGGGIGTTCWGKLDDEITPCYVTRYNCS